MQRSWKERWGLFSGDTKGKRSSPEKVQIKAKPLLFVSPKVSAAPRKGSNENISWMRQFNTTDQDRK
jgi:hypothetical protein